MFSYIISLLIQLAIYSPFFLISFIIYYWSERSIWRGEIVECLVLSNGIGTICLIIFGTGVFQVFQPDLISIISALIFGIEAAYTGKFKGAQKAKATKLVLMDSGEGFTKKSMKYWRENKHKIGKVKMIACMQHEVFLGDVHGDSQYNTMVVGKKGNEYRVMYLAGFSTGYAGEGPSGLLELCKDAGFKNVESDDLHEHFIWTSEKDVCEQCKTNKLMEKRNREEFEERRNKSKN